MVFLYRTIAAFSKQAKKLWIFKHIHHLGNEILLASPSHLKKNILNFELFSFLRSSRYFWSSLFEDGFIRNQINMLIGVLRIQNTQITVKINNLYLLTN